MINLITMSLKGNHCTQAVRESKRVSGIKSWISLPVSGKSDLNVVTSLAMTDLIKCVSLRDLHCTRIGIRDQCRQKKNKKTSGYQE